MKKNLNIIKINGFKGILCAMFIVSCLAAGFVVFPGFVAMHVWNYVSAYVLMPKIALMQGVLLWGIIFTFYMILRKNKLVVCIKSPQGLSEDELKEVFADLKKQSEEDPILKAMLKAREAELKIHEQEDKEIKSDSGKI